MYVLLRIIFFSNHNWLIFYHFPTNFNCIPPAFTSIPFITVHCFYVYISIKISPYYLELSRAKRYNFTVPQKVSVSRTINTRPKRSTKFHSKSAFSYVIRQKKISNSIQRFPFRLSIIKSEYQFLFV